MAGEGDARLEKTALGQSSEGSGPVALPVELVAACYRVLLGRNPENEGVLREKTLQTYDQLLETFINCEEYINRAPNQTKIQYMTAPSEIEVRVEAAELAEMFERIRIEWSELGDTDPYWSVLTEDAFRKNAISPEATAEFYATGSEAARTIDIVARRCGTVVAPSGVCLEFGCGVGRVTSHLARRFRQVIAVDISPSNLALCEKNLRDNDISNVETILIKSPDEVKALPGFDFLNSTIVFQHNPPPVQRYLLSTLLSKLSRGGSFLFQIPTQLPGYRFRISEYLASRARGMEMHCLPMAEIFRVFAEQRLTPLEVLLDGWTGLYGSHSFFGVRQS